MRVCLLVIAVLLVGCIDKRRGSSDDASGGAAAVAGPARPLADPSTLSTPEAKSLCVPLPESSRGPLRGRLAPGAFDHRVIECSGALVWPCVRGVACGPGCVCACDHPGDCALVALEQWYPGVFDGWTARCEQHRCVVDSDSSALQ